MLGSSDALAFDSDGAAGRFGQACDDPQQGAFSTTARTQQGGDLTERDIEIQTIEDRLLGPPLRKDNPQTFAFYRNCCHR
jgi:hypothetical protein